MGRHASGPPPDPAEEWRSIWHVTRVNSQGEEVEFAPWVRLVTRVLINGGLGLLLVGAWIFSAYQVADPYSGGTLSAAEFAAVAFVSGVIAGEIRRSRHPHPARARTLFFLILSCLLGSLPLLLHFRTAALIVALLTGSMALALRFDDFERTEPL